MIFQFVETFKLINVLPLTPQVVALNMEYILPQSWFGSTCVVFPPGQKYAGNFQDRTEIEGSSLKKRENPQEESSVDWEFMKPKKRSTKKKVVSQTPEKEPVIDVEGIQQRLTLFWTFIEASSLENAVGVLSLFSQWPLIRVQEGFVFNLVYAKQRVTLRLCDFSEDQHQTFQKFGCVFSCDANDQLGKLSEVLGALKKDICKALFLSYDTRAPLPAQEIISLRKQFLDWHQSKSITIDPLMMKALPIFATRSGKFVSIAASDAPFAAPQTAPDSTGHFSSHNQWDDLLAPIFPDHILDLRSQDDQELLKLAGSARVSDLQLVKFLFLHINLLPDYICVELLHTIKLLRPWKNKQLNSTVMMPLGKLPIVVFPSGQRRCCFECIDPSDVTLVEILKSKKRI